jgi:uncharacterized membrane protein
MRQRKKRLQEILDLLSDNGGKMYFADLLAKMVILRNRCSGVI